MYNSLFEHLAKLQSNWDTYGADAPSEQSINNAKTFVTNLNLKPSRVAPSAEGGVAITYKEKNCMVEFYNDGGICALWFPEKNSAYAEEVGQDISYEDLIIKIQRN